MISERVPPSTNAQQTPLKSNNSTNERNHKINPIFANCSKICPDPVVPDFRKAIKYPDNAEDTERKGNPAAKA